MTILILLLSVYLLLELMGMVATGKPLPIIIFVICTLVVLVLGKRSCIVGLHEWEYYQQRHKAVGMNGVKHKVVHKLRCTKCDKKKYSFHDPCTSMFDKWKNGELPEVLKFKRLD